MGKTLLKTTTGLLLAAMLAACNGAADSGTGAGSGDGPTQGAGSSNRPDTARDGTPAAE